MQSKAKTVDEYLKEIPDNRKKSVTELRNTILENLPPGFQEGIFYGMIGYVVPHSLYPAGYHCDLEQPLPFMNIASQKNFIAVYHMGLYSNKELLDWFISEYSNYLPTKPDMGKSCIRFKNPEKIPFRLIGELASKITPQEWIKLYETNIKKRQI